MLLGLGKIVVRATPAVIANLRNNVSRIARGAYKLTETQQSSLKRFKRKIPANSRDVKIERLSNNVVRFTADSPAKNISGSFARYIKEVPPKGKATRFDKITYDSTGKIVHIKNKLMR